jgi:putative transposase
VENWEARNQVLAGQKVGIKEGDEGIWQVSFMNYEIGYFDLETCRVEPVDNSFKAKVLSMCSV